VKPGPRVASEVAALLEALAVHDWRRIAVIAEGIASFSMCQEWHTHRGDAPEREFTNGSQEDKQDKQENR
jgi:hypothetical protein